MSALTSPGPAAPRAEFRVFGHDLIAPLQERMWTAGAVLQQARAMPPETYFIARCSDGANVKLRGGLLDIKHLIGTTPEGYEIFEPAGKFALPVGREQLAAILGGLNITAHLARPTYDPADLIALARTHPDLIAVTVEKQRYGFTVNGVICEYARVLFNGALLETACCESADHAALQSVIQQLGLSDRPNTNYLRAARRVVGVT